MRTVCMISRPNGECDIHSPIFWISLFYRQCVVSYSLTYAILNDVVTTPFSVFSTHIILLCQVANVEDLNRFVLDRV